MPFIISSSHNGIKNKTTQKSRSNKLLHKYNNLILHNKNQHKFISTISKVPLIIFTPSDPLVPYRVTVVAVNLAGPGEQETMNFFTREGGVYVINLSCMAYCLPVSEYV